LRDSLTLGRIAGVRFGVNWSWLVVFALIVWTWATGVFPDTNPGYSDRVYVAMAVVAAFLFFGSLLAHELGHALQARREGMEIEGSRYGCSVASPSSRVCSRAPAPSFESPSQALSSHSSSGACSSSSPGSGAFPSLRTRSRRGSATSI